MSLIIDALKRLDRERSIPPSGMVKIASFLKPDLPLRGKDGPSQIADLENAFLRLCEMISGHADLPEVLGEIVKECVFCVRAHRAGVYMMEDGKEYLGDRLKFISSFNQQGEQVFLEEEETIARESLAEQKALLLKKEDLDTRCPVDQPGWTFTAMMAFPLLSRNRPVGVLSAVLFNTRQGFDDRELQLFSGFARLASIAVEMDDLFREVRRGASRRKEFENHLDRILSRLGTDPGT